MATGPRPDRGAAAPVHQAEPAEATAGSKWGWRALVAFVAGGLIAAGGFSAARLTDDDSSALQQAQAERTLPEVDVDEPAAYVAQTLGPSVVQIETEFGLGSGVIYDDGLILTNNHVIEGAEELAVSLADGRRLDATLVGTDHNTDIAVISVGTDSGLPAAELALGEEVEVGQLAIAIGSPFQLQQSVTAGIVSAVNRPVPNRNNSIVAMIQTDAPINPGNSGGALADKDGRVVGINTAIQTDGLSATNAGVGFAVPINTAVRIANLLAEGKPIRSGFLGVQGAKPVGGEAGVEITVVTDPSAAKDAGLRVGDRVLTIDGAPVTSLAELAGLVLAHQAGDDVTLEVVRDGQRIDVFATLNEVDS